jgi:hypothetical protein
MKPKHRAIALFMAIAFFFPIGEVLVVGRVDPFAGKAAWIYGVLSAITIYWWYYLDKIEHGFRAGALQNIGVAVFSLVGLPVYFFRSRGFRGGAVATAAALAVLIVASLLTYAGELVGQTIAS